MDGTSAHRTTPTLDEIEALLVNNPDLHRIQAHLGRFNPIKVMGMEHMEIRHSAILGWLMDPQESHGMGDAFLKAFLMEAMRGHDVAGKPTALDILQSDLSDAEVRPEWRSIDLLVLSPRNGWVFVIENKVHSALHSNQLDRYMEIAHSTFIRSSHYSCLKGIFLSLNDEDPNDSRFAPIRYDAVYQLLEQVLASRSHPLSAEVAAFINHYLQIIREAVRMDQDRLDLEKLAREIYRDHKRVLDFIVENGKSTDFAMAAEAVFGENVKYPDVVSVGDMSFVYLNGDMAAVSFLPEGWFDVLGGPAQVWPGCEKYWAGFPLITWIRLTTSADGTSGRVKLYGEVGPLKDHGLRTALIQSIGQVGKDNARLRIKFQKGATDEGKRYSRFFQQNTFAVDDVHDPDRISAAIHKALKSFDDEFDAIREAIGPVIQTWLEAQ
ncbi:PD-(D/E)XK nuclease family protein [Sedimentimonas flavescens]|uniref:PDDEXK-like family protein n=1 Tax=Sedimentimonas flavescens TaxID=2851012 RepID=UPI001C4A2676|nr:PD-(D/E)XK nuclease family protein [Sedimentimonas flavescens]MBW0159684.1 PD-(D/E)XK nuclease family protein [Sedimentimonas flavescens]